jgi:uncharacterized membrane protein YphA (DoxX/SURF4 family)
MIELFVWIAVLAIEAFVLVSWGICTKGRFTSFKVNPILQSVGFVTLRVGLGAMFLLASYPKMLSPYEFASLVAQYQLLPLGLVNYFAAWLPPYEAVIGLGLIVTRWSKAFSAMILFLMTLFIVALVQALIRDLGITCGCFDIEGAADKVGAWTALLRDLALWPLILWLWKSGPNVYLWEHVRKLR